MPLPLARAQLSPTRTLAARFGAVYDYISQSYYSSLVDSAADSLELGARLNEEYLNQPSLFADLVWRPLGDNRFRGEGHLESSKDLFRGRLASSVNLRTPGYRLSFVSSLEARRNLSEADAGDIGQEYTLVRTRIKYQIVSSRLRPFLSVRGEINDLNGLDSASFSNGYRKVGAQLGFDALLGEFDNLTVLAGFDVRSVPDYSALDYQLSRVEVEYSGFRSSSSYSLSLGLDNRDYSPAGDDNDQLWLRLQADGQVYLGHQLTLYPRFTFESIDYRLDTSSFNSDQRLFSARSKLSRRFGSLSVGMGPHLEILRESTIQSQVSSVSATTDSLLYSENYRELGWLVSVEYFQVGGLMLTAENLLGYRDIETPGSFLTDHWINRLSWFSTFQITSSLKLDIIGSVEREWHDQQVDDNTFYLLNTRLSHSI